MTITPESLDAVAAGLPLFVAIPMLLGGILVMVGNRLRIHAMVLTAYQALSLVASVVMIYAFTDNGGAIAHAVGPWPTGIAIPFAADMFTALMLTFTSILLLVCTWFSYASYAANSMFFAPLVLVLTTGVNGALLTADLFNLFVFLEVMLLPSYGLFVLSANRKTPLRRVDGARLYVTVNLFTSTVFLAGVGFLYGTAGTVNLALLAEAAQHDDTVAMAGAICLFALGIKASVVPMHGWLARSYPSTSPAITALFSGLHTKVAIYGIYRIYSIVFGGDTRFLWVGVVLFSLSMVIGVLGAVGEKTTRSILAFHMVSQLGYILLGVALFTELGLTAGIFYLIHHMVVKAALFLSTGAVEVRYGTGTIGDLGGVARAEPVIAVAFFIAALSMAGIPPFSGFAAKLMLVLAAVERGEILAVVCMILVSLITLVSMMKIWAGMFWEKKNDDELPDVMPSRFTPETAGSSARGAAPLTQTLTQSHTETAVHAEETPRRRINASLAAPAVVLTLVTITFGLGAQLLFGWAEVAAGGLLDPSAYIEAVIAG
ncbi:MULTISPECIES: monovalent cation/H+ antiporter subunit D family protein [Citricoccus]|uniref:Monovalent cation/H+ antiporter subunit D family protein n=1 Tax=Citricoccus muralis TaxID=169134 RepID=A0ABY8H2J1_9MICC|nr:MULTISPECIES: monovalent cation/H+ antiporter subunit D family protein [Citricoccus]WBL18351.1 monovalent cation/H+ antiporter subunit D family protein [Citricoccus sp. NR2]WFP15270.1 monovalent cation/H+ antiporter subunit D family protein [Citricoccus muralis]